MNRYLLQEIRAYRSQRGQISVVISILAFLILAVIGFWAFEVNRLQNAVKQLKTDTDAAALAGAAVLASLDSSDPAVIRTIHTKARESAIDVFRRNGVFSTSFKEASDGFNPANPPGPDKSEFLIEFVDQTTGQVVGEDDPRGTAMRFTGAFGLVPVFAKFVGLGNNYPIISRSLAGLPKLDIMLLMDLSASIDDQTRVTLARRFWDGSKVKISPVLQSTIKLVVKPPPSGTRLNALPPQFLNTVIGETGVSFSADLRAKRGDPDAGSPPGNFGRSLGLSRRFTDLVVNIGPDGEQPLIGQPKFTGPVTVDGYTFDSLDTLVEAARGNLENQSVFEASKANTNPKITVTPRAGYQKTYRKIAAKYSQPLALALDAAWAFIATLQTPADCHFGVVGFSTRVGRAEADKMREYDISDNTTDPRNSQQDYSLLGVPLSNSGDNAETIKTRLRDVESPNRITALRRTAIGPALQAALDQLNESGRPGARKVIVLFSDGVPNEPAGSTPEDISNGQAAARTAAVRARDEGVAIYTIAFNQNREIFLLCRELFNDQNPDPTSGGLAAIAGNNGRFFPVPDENSIRQTFLNVARRLVAVLE